MKMRRILSFALALTMLLSLFSGMSFANAAAPRMVPVGEELAYDPLAETASIAYEQHEDGYAVTLDRAADSVTMHLTAVPDSGRKAEGARLYIRTGTELKAGTAYRVSFALWSEKKLTEYTACFDGADTASAYGKLEKRSIEAGGTDRVEYLVTPEKESGELVLRLLLGGAESGALRLSGLAVEESSAEAAGNNVMLGELIIQFSLGNLSKGAVTTIRDVRVDEVKAVYKNMLDGDFSFEGSRVKKTYDDLMIHTDNGTEVAKVKEYEVDYNRDNVQKGYGAKYGLKTKTSVDTVSYTAFANADGRLNLEFQLGKADHTDITIKDISVKEITTPAQTVTNGKFVSVLAEVNQDGGDYTLESLSRNADNAVLNITKAPASGTEGYMAKLLIRTGVTPQRGKEYTVSFDIKATKAQAKFHALYNGVADKSYGGEYEIPLAAETTRIISHNIEWYQCNGKGELVIQLELGLIDQTGGNEFTVSNVSITEYSVESSREEVNRETINAADYDVQSGYSVDLTRTENSATLNILKTPGGKLEAWKNKLFIDTGVHAFEGNSYRVTMDVTAEKDMDFEVYYNRDDEEKGYDAVFDLHATGGKRMTLEKVFTAERYGDLKIQLSLGKVPAENAVTVSNVRIERAEYTYSDVSALPAPLIYRTPGAVSYWAHNDYTVAVTGTDSASTVNIVKLFVRTGAMLQAGKSYQVRANLLAARAQDFEVCYNNEETEKGFDALYGQKLAAGVKTTVDKKITVPASMTDAGELVIQFSVGGAVANDITVSDVSVQEVRYGSSVGAAPDTVIGLRQSAQAAGTLDVSREKLSYHMTKIAADSSAITMAGANLREGDRYTVAFTAKADKALNGTLTLAQAGGKSTAISQQFALTTEPQQYSFTTAGGLSEGGFYDIFWQFGSAEKTPVDVEISDITVFAPSERLEIMPSGQRVTVNGVEVKPDAYNINGSNYFKLRDLAMLLNGTDGQFVVRYNGQTGLVSLTTGKEYTPVGGELTVGTDKSTTCVRSPQNISINGKEVKLKAYNIGGNNFFKLRDLGKLLNFQVDYIAASNTAVIASPLTPERQEATYAYDMFFRPEIDGESQPFVGDTMPYYEDGTYYIYYLKEGGDSYNHSVYLTTTKDFVNYTERPTPVLDASRADVQDSWIGTGSVVKADKDYYFFYTGFNASGSQEYHEKIMAAKGTSPTDFTKVSGLSITPPAELNQKNDFRDPQAYYDPATRTISLTVTASKNGAASILKYTLDKDLTNVTYDGVIFTDPTGAFWNLECSDTFQIGDKWYLTYSGQEDAVWYATADSRFGPYSEPHGSPVRHHRQADLPVRGKQQRHLYGAQAVYAVTGAYRQPRQ